MFLLAPKRAPCWVYYADTRYHKRIRRDMLFAFTRNYSREVRAYIWDLTIGRLKILWMNW